MTKSQMSNAQILNLFEIACFNLVNYPGKKKYQKEFGELEREISKRLHLTEEELKQITEGGYVK